MEERIPAYIRLGVRLLYQTPANRIDSSAVRAMLKNMTLRQGRKFNDPSSKKEISQFILYHGISLDEGNILSCCKWSSIGAH